MIKTILLGGLVVVYASRFRPKVITNVLTNGLTSTLILVAETLVLVIGLFLISDQTVESDVLSHIGVCVYVIGVSIATVARLQLRNNYAPGFSARKPEKIVSSGMYTIVRNPVYLGMLLAVFGFALVFNVALAGLSLTAFFLYKKQIQKEELLLSEVDPEGWNEFQVKTQWRLVPYVW